MNLLFRCWKRYFLPYVMQSRRSTRAQKPLQSSIRSSAVFAGLAVLSLSSCGTPTPDMGTDRGSLPSMTTPEADRSASPSVSPSAAGSKTAALPNAALPRTVPVKVFTVDSQCQNLVSEQVALPVTQTMQAAIAKVIADRDSADFSLAGYRVNVQDSVATVDLRVAPGSKRGFQSLSSCEQLALFGSIRKTLTSNPQWKIQSVQFTEKGQEIVL